MGPLTDSLLVLLILLPVALSTKSLILIENYGIKESHSVFFGYLTSLGHELTYKMADDSSLAIFQFGELVYDNVIIMAPSTHDFGGDVNANAFAEFIDDGGNLFVVADSTVGDALRDLGYECGVEFEEAGTKVIDHMSYDISDEGLHSRIYVPAEQVLKNPLIVGNVETPLIYEGIGLVTDDENQLIIPVVRAGSTAYSFFPNDKITEHPGAVGTDTVLVASLQARNNARATFIGSMDMLSDKFMLSPAQKINAAKRFEKCGNLEFVQALVKWTFKHVGVLRVTDVKHHMAGETVSPSYYTVTDNAVYSITIEEMVNAKWTEFKAKDVQMEFVRIDPFVRTTLFKENGSFVAKFKLPDVYGVFQFKVDYKRQGYTFVHSATQVSVRPLEHTQYERFIPVAYPYYVSAFSMMVGVLLFSFVFLYFKEPVAAVATKGKST